MKRPRNILNGCIYASILLTIAVAIVGCVKSDAQLGVNAQARAGTIEKKDESHNAGTQAKPEQAGFFNISVIGQAVGGSAVVALVSLALWLRSKNQEDKQETERHKDTCQVITKISDAFEKQADAQRQFAERLFEKHVKAMADAYAAFAAELRKAHGGAA